MEAIQQHLKNTLSDTSIPTVAADGQILDVRIADSVADRSSDSDDFPI